MGVDESNPKCNSNNINSENGNESNIPFSPKLEEKSIENPQQSKIEEDEPNEKIEFYSLSKIEQPSTPEMQLNSPEKDENQEDEPQMSTTTGTKDTPNKEITIIKIVPKLSNISIKANLGCIVDLKKIARNTLNVIYKPREYNFLTKYLEGTNFSANIFSSGKLVCTGIKSRDNIKKVIHKFGKIVRKFGHKVKIKNIEITNLVEIYNVNFMINLRSILNNLKSLTKNNKNVKKLYFKRGNLARVTFGIKNHKSKLCSLIHASGKIIITGGKNENEIQNFFDYIYPEILRAKIE